MFVNFYFMLLFDLTPDRGVSEGHTSHPENGNMDYLVRLFHVVQQQLRDYIIAMPDVLSYVTSSLTSVSYIEPVPNASKSIDYPHLYEELVNFETYVSIPHFSIWNKRILN